MTHMPNISFVGLVWRSRVPCMDHEIQRQILSANNLYFCINLGLDTKKLHPHYRTISCWDDEDSICKVYMGVYDPKNRL